jgi:MYXO-CTERM domain-containing protein
MAPLVSRRAIVGKVRILSGIATVALVGLTLGRAARADTFEGRVTASQGRFIDGGLLIVTDVTVLTDDGRAVTVVERGGRAGGLGQISWPSPPIPEVGARVRVTATALVADDVEVLAPGYVPFVRTGPTAGEHYLYWASGCVFLTYDADGTVDLEGDSELAIIDDVLATWNDATSSCSYLTLTAAGVASIDASKKVGNHHVTRILFRDDQWCRPNADNTTCSPLPSGAAGLTTVTFVDDASSSRDGEIVDADVELNGEQFSISSNGTTLGGPNCKSDLANTLTHELGHVMGLDHTCLAPGDPPKVDGNGEPVPLCADTSDPQITVATMYIFQQCGETKKSSPAPDDIDAVCAAYPRENDPESCIAVGEGSGCCSAGGTSGRDTAGAILIALLAAAAYRRRRSG